jgi:hypothetical protein
MGGGRMNWSELPEEFRAMARRAAMPDYAAWEQKIRATGGCAYPIRMSGGLVRIDAATGELLDAFHTDNDPLGYLMIPCGNRRASVCPSCSQTYRGDTFQLIRAGLVGGKGVSDEVAGHPAIFATVTAPSFGAVHTAHRETGRDGKPVRCRIRRNAETCPHGKVLACPARHEKDDRTVGQALCLDCYDYPGAVLFNANAGELWRRLTIYLRRELAAAIGESQKGFDRQAKVAFAKVAEYQARGVVHFHAIIRLDGPDGPAMSPPSWGSADLLDACLRRAVRAIRVDVPDPANRDGTRTMAFGRQVDTQPITEAADASDGGMTSRHVAAYVAKYVTKAAETTGTVDRRIKKSELELLQVPPHTERMIRTCFELDEQPAYADLLLGKWAHMLGYRGHVATKSRAYSTTYGELRGERRAHREAERRERQGLPPTDDRPVITEARWTFLRAGLAYGEQPIVDSIRRQQQPTWDSGGGVAGIDDAGIDDAGIDDAA